MCRKWLPVPRGQAIVLLMCESWHHRGSGRSSHNCHADLMKYLGDKLRPPAHYHSQTTAIGIDENGVQKKQEQYITVILPHFWVQSLEECLDLE